MTRPPVIAAWGAGVDSTAMIIECVARGEPIDMVLFADTGSEKAETYAYLAVFERWMEARGLAHETVRYVPRNFKHWPPYDSLHTNMLTNGTLPSKAFGRGACSLKAKVGPQDAWAERWDQAIRCWAAGQKVGKLIGYDASPADTRRYAHAEGCHDPRFDYRYPLREWGWDRRACEDRIAREGLPIPVKSSCFCCPAMTPAEVDRLSVEELRTIVLMEARAKPRLRTVEGLWRRRVLGCRGATPKPGAITDYIRERCLLPPDEVDQIVATAPTELLAFQAAQSAVPLSERVSMGEWLHDFQSARNRLGR